MMKEDNDDNGGEGGRGGGSKGCEGKSEDRKVKKDESLFFMIIREPYRGEREKWKAFVGELWRSSSSRQNPSLTYFHGQ